MSFWREGQLPPVEKMPARRTAPESSPRLVRRALAAVAAVALGITGAVSLYGALQDSSGRSSPFMALAMLLPVIILLRYAWTGEIKMS